MLASLTGSAKLREDGKEPFTLRKTPVCRCVTELDVCKKGGVNREARHEEVCRPSEI